MPRRKRKNNSSTNRHDNLQQAIGYRFKNTGLLKQALTRQSAIEEGYASGQSYQSLEFLGDRILNLCIAHLIFQEYLTVKNACTKNNKVPGILNQVYEKLVSNRDAVLPKIGKMLALDCSLIRGRGEKNVTEKMFSDGVEALLGAVYLDCSELAPVLTIIKKFWFSYLKTGLKTIQPQLLELSIEEQLLSCREHTVWEEDNSDKYFDKYLSDNLSVSTTSETEWYSKNTHIFDFRKMLFSWGFSNLENTRVVHANTPPLKKCYGDVYSYYEAFIPYITEEARAAILQGKELVETKKATRVVLYQKEVKRARNVNNPAVFILEGKLPVNYQSGASSLVLQLDSENGQTLYGLATIVNFDEENDDFQTNKVRIFQVRIDQGLLTYDVLKVTKWTAYVLASLVTFERMYNICKTKPKPSFLESIIEGSTTDVALPHETLYRELEHLNSPQKKAVEKFIQLESGIQVIQGPPGTGKTTTIVALLKALTQHTKKRILVCAPSNKAVQVLAKRFFNEAPDFVAIVTGVEKRLAPELKPYFLHAWGKVKLAKLNKLIEGLANLSLELEKRGGEEPGQVNATLNSKQDLINSFLMWVKASLSLFDELRVIDLKLPYSLLEQLQAQLKTAQNLPLCRTKCNLLGDTLSKITSCFVQMSNILTKLNKKGAKGKPPPIEKVLLNKARIIFCTLCVSGRPSMQVMQEVDILIVDESSQCVEAETLLPFIYNPKKCLIVGDTKQLPAVVLSKQAKANHFDTSLMHRLIELPEAPSFSLLTIQHRMHSKIREFPSNQFYGGMLRDDSLIKKRANLFNTRQSPILGPCAFIDIKTGKEKLVLHSYVNHEEAFYVKALLLLFRDMIKIPIKGKVGVITFYAAQADLIKMTIKKAGIDGVDVYTVDGFQGDERDIIIISFVRANNQNQIGFLNDSRRLNVAITRPKHALIMLGHVKTLKAKKSDVSYLVRDMMRRKLMFSQKHLKDIVFKKQLPNKLVYHTNFKLEIPPHYALIDAIKKTIPHQNYPTNLRWFQQALTRPSAIEERLYHAAKESYQVLEWFGDRVVNFSAALCVYNKYPEAKPSDLHEHYKQLISNKESLMVVIAKKLQIGRYLLRGNGELIVKEKMLADAIEAIFAALFLQNHNEKSALALFTHFYNTYELVERNSVSTESPETEDPVAFLDRVSQLSISDQETELPAKMTAQSSSELEVSSAKVFESELEISSSELGILSAKLFGSELGISSAKFNAEEMADYFGYCEPDYPPHVLEYLRRKADASVSTSDKSKREVESEYKC